MSHHLTNKVLLKIIGEIPLFSALSGDNLKKSICISPLPSQTNSSYKISLNATSYILKVPQANTNKQINRENEITNTQLAFKLGLCAEVLWHNKRGVSLVRYLNNTRPLKSEDLHNPVIIKKLADCLLKLQQSEAHFKGNLHSPKPIREALQYYYKRCTNKQQKHLTLHYQKALLAIDNIEINDLAKKPSHIDLIPENILIEEDKNQRIWIIDWEYSAMASPLWDIANICNSAHFTDQQSTLFLKSVFIDANKQNKQLLIHYQQIMKGLSTCWLAAFKAA